MNPLRQGARPRRFPSCSRERPGLDTRASNLRLRLDRVGQSRFRLRLRMGATGDMKTRHREPGTADAEIESRGASLACSHLRPNKAHLVAKTPVLKKRCLQGSSACTNMRDGQVYLLFRRLEFRDRNGYWLSGLRSHLRSLAMSCEGEEIARLNKT